VRQKTYAKGHFLLDPYFARSCFFCRRTALSGDALKALFVIWSDVYVPMGHEPIPFEKETYAKEFLKEHKGRKSLDSGI